ILSAHESGHWNITRARDPALSLAPPDLAMKFGRGAKVHQHSASVAHGRPHIRSARAPARLDSGCKASRRVMRDFRCHRPALRSPLAKAAVEELDCRMAVIVQGPPQARRNVPGAVLIHDDGVLIADTQPGHEGGEPLRAG